ncbi:hypothetical protein ACWCXB_17915 [Streptomyces sp. NPDC001514]
MRKRIWAALAGAAATTAAVVVITNPGAPDAPDAGRRTGTESTVTLIGFKEVARLDPTGSMTATRQVDIYAEHRADAVSTLRFVITTEGRVTEERLWEAEHPDSITVRNWDSCSTTSEPTPAPRPDSLEVIVTELFGPDSVPPGAKKAPGGATSWVSTAGLVTTKYTDNGGPYPDRVVEIKGPDGSIGSVIDHSRISHAAALPEWRDGWQTCRPTAGSA